MTRRTLLSALCLPLFAPLVKLVRPKAKPMFATNEKYVVGCDVGSDGYSTVLTFENMGDHWVCIDELRVPTLPDDRKVVLAFTPFANRPIIELTPQEPA